MPIGFPFGGNSAEALARNFGKARGVFFSTGAMYGIASTSERWYAVGASGRAGRSPLGANYISEELVGPWATAVLWDIATNPNDANMLAISAQGGSAITRGAFSFDGINFAFGSGFANAIFRATVTTDAFLFRHSGGIYRVPFGLTAAGGVSVGTGVASDSDLYALPLARENVVTVDPNFNLWWSFDSGVTWAAAGTYLAGVSQPSFAQHLKTGRLIAAGGAGGIQYSDDAGASWSGLVANPGRTPSQTRNFFCCAYDPTLDAVLAGGQDGLLVASSDGAVWEQIPTPNTDSITALRTVGNTVIGYAGQAFFRSQVPLTLS